MNLAVLVLVALSGLFHVAVFVMESFLLHRPGVARVFLVTPDTLPAVRPWAFNQGWYNLFLALGALGGIAVSLGGAPVVGTTLSLFACGCMAGAAIVLAFSDPRMRGSALKQGLFPLLALLASLLALAATD
ncbi:DUF1304 domain-containing protein [Nocardiopsis ansamitocini]|uniref:DUF1304 domain-containing protein n=1 Tax=Nocardiopsis ansamitocini TaxID=1670832 RepID=A0A9W6UI23_9ACTN|nr:DUF1304 domain-containing protein [Nocardiopsis ansamitocini]GLU49486.1 hypothetical protein Nans01_38370 [Nocardiopsis ansamitocini]